MPLLDHSNAPYRRTHSYAAFVKIWAIKVTEELNGGILPAGFRALPILRESHFLAVEAALAAGEPSEPPDRVSSNWAVGEPTGIHPIEPPFDDSTRVEVTRTDDESEIVAVVEFVERPHMRCIRSCNLLAGRCAEHLLKDRGLIVVDVVGSQEFDFRLQLLDSVGAVEPSLAQRIGDGEASIASYRLALTPKIQLEIHEWRAPLAVGKPLPTLPLWLAVDLAVPLDLEMSHAATCEVLELRPAG
jgi:hypothetical protein